MGAALRHPPPPEDRQGGTPGGSLLMPPHACHLLPCPLVASPFLSPQGLECGPLDGPAKPVLSWAALASELALLSPVSPGAGAFPPR